MNRACNRNRGLSLLELLAVVTLMGIIAMVVVPRFGGTADDAKATGCSVNRNNIEVQAQLWFRNKGTWPQSNLNDLMGDPDYFPDGPVTCPVDGSAYSFDPLTQRVTGHNH